MEHAVAHRRLQACVLGGGAAQGALKCPLHALLGGAHALLKFIRIQVASVAQGLAAGAASLPSASNSSIVAAGGSLREHLHTLLRRLQGGLTLACQLHPALKAAHRLLKRQIACFHSCDQLLQLGERSFRIRLPWVCAPRESLKGCLKASPY